MGGFMKQIAPKPLTTTRRIKVGKGKKARYRTVTRTIQPRRAAAPPSLFGSSRRSNDDWANIRF